MHHLAVLVCQSGFFKIVRSAMMFNILVMTDENLAFLPDNPVTQKIALVESLSVINYEPKNRGRIAEKIVKFDLQLNTKRGLVHTLG